jgi:hypothetical protein
MREHLEDCREAVNQAISKLMDSVDHAVGEASRIAECDKCGGLSDEKDCPVCEIDRLREICLEALNALLGGAIARALALLSSVDSPEARMKDAELLAAIDRGSAAAMDYMDATEKARMAAIESFLEQWVDGK